MRAFGRDGLDRLMTALAQRGHVLIGPRLRDGAIVLDAVRTAADLPAGWTADVEAGSYRLRRRDDGLLFGHAVGPHAWKRFLYPPALRLWRAERGDGDGRDFRLTSGEAEPVAYAFIGVRPCDLAAIAVQDRVLLGGAHVDPAYRARRERAFIVAVQCGEAAATCFCASMGTGPRARGGFDLALTELAASGTADAAHEEAPTDYLVEVGSPRGEEVLAGVPSREATAYDLAAADAACRRAEAGMGRSLATDGLPEALLRSIESPRWERVAERCLTCGNCTLVCPTCFCSVVEDTSNLKGRSAERWRRWDSCFGVDFSYLHGGAVRASAAARYRQWLLHKLATWHEQFGTSGCVGCGRCITWCPVGIDITEEASALCAADRAVMAGPAGRRAGRGGEADR